MGTLAPESPDHSGVKLLKVLKLLKLLKLLSVNIPFDVPWRLVLVNSFLRTYTMLGDAAGSGRGAAAGFKP